MQLTVQIPDELAARFTTGDDLSRLVLEALAVEEYRNGHLTRPEVRRLLGFENPRQLDDFLQAHNVHEDCTAEEIAREAEGMRRLGP